MRTNLPHDASAIASPEAALAELAKGQFLRFSPVDGWGIYDLNFVRVGSVWTGHARRLVDDRLVLRDSHINREDLFGTYYAITHAGLQEAARNATRV